MRSEAQFEHDVPRTDVQDIACVEEQFPPTMHCIFEFLKEQFPPSMNYIFEFLKATRLQRAVRVAQYPPAIATRGLALKSRGGTLG